MPSVPNFNAQQAALQAAIAMGGERGQAQYNAEQSAIQQSTAGALNILGGIQNNGELHGSAEHGAQMNAQQQALSQLYSNTASQGQQYFNQDITRLNAANAARYQQAQVAASAAAGRGQREAGLQRERMQIEREQMALERLRIQNEKEQMEREQELGTIANYSDAGKNLGWDDEYTNQVTQAGDQVIDSEGTTSTPFAQMQMAAADVSSNPDATWADVQNAVKNAHDNWVATYGTNHGYTQAMSLVLASYAPRYGADGTQIGAKPMPEGWMPRSERAAADQKALVDKTTQSVWDALKQSTRADNRSGWAPGQGGNGSWGGERVESGINDFDVSAIPFTRTADEYGRTPAAPSEEDRAIAALAQLPGGRTPSLPALSVPEVRALLNGFPPEVADAVQRRFGAKLASGQPISLLDLASITGLDALLLNAGITGPDDPTPMVEEPAAPSWNRW